MEHIPPFKTGFQTKKISALTDAYKNNNMKMKQLNSTKHDSNRNGFTFFADAAKNAKNK